MRKKWVGVVIFVAYVLGAAAVAKTPVAEKAPSPFEQMMMANEKNYLAAIKKGDMAFLRGTLSDDFSFVQYDGQLYERHEMIDQFGEGGFDVLAYNMKVVSASDNVAIVTYDVVLTVPPAEDQGPPPRYQHFSTVWVKQGDGWKMKFQQMTPSHWGDW